MGSTRVLISGASVAGPALAYWLERYGFEVTVVERADGLRPGGQAIDVRGPALEVAARMGLAERLQARSTGIRGMSAVDDEGRELWRTTEHTFSGGDTSRPDVEILRDDLAALLVEAGGPGVEYLHGDSIAALTQDDAGARVRFESGVEREFDVVVGADGVHSHTRRLVFGPEEEYLRHLGGYLGVWTAPNDLGLDRWEVVYQMGGAVWGGMVMSVRDNAEARVYIGIESDEPPSRYLDRSTEELKRLVARHYAHAGWEMPRLLKHMWDAPDFHFDALAQIRMDSWSRGRVTLLGDAGYCGSPASGQGTSMAMVGAYVLAGELHAARGYHAAAFAAYERELRGYVTANQDLALRDRPQRQAGPASETVPEGPGDEMYAVVNAYTLKDY